MADIKPVYKKQDGKWVKQNAYEMQNTQWVKISTISAEEIMASYIGYSMIEDVYDDSFFTQNTIQRVESDNLVGTYTVTLPEGTPSGTYIYWITPTPINTIYMAGFPVSYSPMADAGNGIYRYNGVDYYVYSTDSDFLAGTFTFIIT